MMLLDEERTFYDLLEVSPDASPGEIRSAYLRVKAAYRKDSVALYSLIDESETTELLKKIEEAFHVLSQPELRREYDTRHGTLLGAAPEPAPVQAKAPAPNVVSIDRMPPMDHSASDPSILIPPTTDFERRGTDLSSRVQHGPSAFGPAFDTTNEAHESDSIFNPAPEAPRPAPVAAPARTENPIPIRHPSDAFNEQAIVQEVQSEQEWRGPFLRKVREARNVPLEELSDYTKISKSYLIAIEEENYARLPAPVYLRGFITQMAKYLRLPHEKVSQAYVARFNAAMAEREKQKRSGLR